MNNNEDNYNSALSVNKGIAQPPSVNPHIMANLKKRSAILPVDTYISGVLAGDNVILGQAITLIESSLPKHQEIAQKVIEACLPFAGKALRIGITGVPGVGKSTFIEAYGKFLTNQGKKVAVLAIDPSSQRTKGSILGDKTRMEELSVDNNAFIRPSPSAGSLGGVARKTRETSVLCEAAGYDHIIIETVGVGQSEIAVHSMVDFFLLLMLAGAGDELQGIKRGIMEMADAIVINKADGDNITKAKSAKIQYQTALHLFPPPESGWLPKVDICSAIEFRGVDKVHNIITEYEKLTKESGYFHKKRVGQEFSIMKSSIDDSLKMRFYNQPEIKEEILNVEQQVKNQKISPYIAAQKLLDIYFKGIKTENKNH